MEGNLLRRLSEAQASREAGLGGLDRLRDAAFAPASPLPGKFLNRGPLGPGQNPSNFYEFYQMYDGT